MPTTRSKRRLAQPSGRMTRSKTVHAAAGARGRHGMFEALMSDDDDDDDDDSDVDEEVEQHYTDDDSCDSDKDDTDDDE